MQKAEAINIRDGEQNDIEAQLDVSLRPAQLSEYIGQAKVKENLRVFMKAALKRLNRPTVISYLSSRTSLTVAGCAWLVYPVETPS